MRKATFAAVLAMVAVGALALAGAGSAAQTNSGGPATLRAATTQLAANVVRQVGLRNYAGPNCPGRGWNCTTSTRVLQIATDGGTNVGECTGGSVVVLGATQTCSVTQLGGTSNTARCTERSSDSAAVQTCTILQTGDTNVAYVSQSINQNDGSPQTGTQTATVTQGTASVKNQLQLNQSVNQSVKTGSTQTQNAYQTAVVHQTATGSGTNYAGSSQSQLQKALIRGTTQDQDTTSIAADCNLLPGPSAPNACADVQQHSISGKNDNRLRQSINQDENSTGVATQRQGSFDGGLDGHVHQDTNSGRSLNSVNQSKKQHETAAAGSSQTQYDPISCCGFASQVGGSGNRESIRQASSLSAGPGANQQSDLMGTSRTPDGTCTVSQHASINGGSAKNSDTVSPCPYLALGTSCSSNTDLRDQVGGVGCSAPPGDTTDPNPPDPFLTKLVRNNSDSDFTSSTTVPFTGGTVEYDLVYSNSGEAGPADGVIVTDPLPAGATFVSCTASCKYNAKTRTITWALGTVNFDDSVEMFFTATIAGSAGADIANTATATNIDGGPSVSSDPATVHINGD